MAVSADIKPGARVRGGPFGLDLHEVRTVTSAGDSVQLVVKDAAGRLSEFVLGPDDLQKIEVLPEGTQWTFDGDPDDFKLALEAHRIRLAHLFDPYMAVHASAVTPLPHQIQAVYGTMLDRQPLRFLLADDPGAGKTIMSGLLLKELMTRGVVRRAMIVAPGSLVEQWQDELAEKFGLEFTILTNDLVAASRSRCRNSSSAVRSTSREMRSTSSGSPPPNGTS